MQLKIRLAHWLNFSDSDAQRGASPAAAASAYQLNSPLPIHSNVISWLYQLNSHVPFIRASSLLRSKQTIGGLLANSYTNHQTLLLSKQAIQHLTRHHQCGTLHILCCTLKKDTSLTKPADILTDSPGSNLRVKRAMTRVQTRQWTQARIGHGFCEVC